MLVLRGTPQNVGKHREGKNVKVVLEASRDARKYGRLVVVRLQPRIFDRGLDTVKK
jgi:hypothetical protein